jgi:hypothetical protein
MLELVSGAHIAQLCLYHGAEVSGRVVVKLENPAQVSVEDDDHSSAKIVGLHGTCKSFRKR